MKTILFYNRKGGVGKTTSVVNVGACMSKVYAKRVLIIDVDPQGNSTRYLTTDKYCKLDKTIIDCFEEGAKKENIIHKVEIRPNLRINPVPTRMSLISSNEDMDFIEPEDEDIEHFIKFMESVKNDYDFCLVDAPPQPSVFVRIIMMIADFLVVPMQPDIDSVKGYKIAIKELKKIKEESNGKYAPAVLGVMINQHMENSKGINHFVQKIKSVPAMKCFETCISNAKVVRDASSCGRPVIYYKPTHKVAEEYLDLTREILERVGK